MQRIHQDTGDSVVDRPQRKACRRCPRGEHLAAEPDAITANGDVAAAGVAAAEDDEVGREAATTRVCDAQPLGQALPALTTSHQPVPIPESQTGRRADRLAPREHHRRRRDRRWSAGGDGWSGQDRNGAQGERDDVGIVRPRTRAPLARPGAEHARSGVRPER
jgi:hypothetical protein